MPVHVSFHALLRHAERGLGLGVDEESLAADPATAGRVARGLLRVYERGRKALGRDVDSGVLVVGTRALVLRNGVIVTVLVAPTSRGFNKAFLRKHGALCAA